MSALGRALRRKFKTPRDAIIALGLNPDLLAMDSRVHIEDTEMPKLTSRVAIKAAAAISAFMYPILAKDQRFDPAIALVGVTARNYREKIPAIVAAVKRGTTGKLAYDANPDPDDLTALLEALGNEDDGQDEVNPANPGTNTETMQQPLSPDHEGLPNSNQQLSLDQFLAGKLSAKDHAKAKQLIGDAKRMRRPGRVARDQDMDGVEPILDFLARCGLNDQQLNQAAELILRDDDEPAQDEPEPFAGRPRPGGQMDPISRDARILAHDARQRTLSDASDSFAGMFPGVAPARALPSDNPPQRPARIDPAGQASFEKMFPAAARIKVL